MLFEPRDPREKRRFSDGAVVSFCPLASSCGAYVLRSGGNAVDAAVATALALAVTYPQAGNLGGGGFMLVYEATGKAHFVDYRECAPSTMDLSLYVDDKSVRTSHVRSGGAPVCVPGTVAGLAAALDKLGTWSWRSVVEAVIDLAEVGHWMTTRQSSYFHMYEEQLSRFAVTRASYFRDGGLPLPGTLFRQPDLAFTLRLLADEGPEAFYRGEIAKRIVKTVQEHGGLLKLEDLEQYQPKWREPIAATFCGRKLLTAPLPSGGGLVVRIASVLIEAGGVSDIHPESPERYLAIARALRCAFEVRRRLAGDPDFMSDEETQHALEVIDTCHKLASDIDAVEDYLGIAGNGPVTGDLTTRDTTHFCVVDGIGNAVSNTYSLNTLFGSELVPEGCGFLLNNSMDDFSLVENQPNYYGIVEDGRNSPSPGRRPTGSMAPTIAVDDSGRIELLVGAAGGPRIPSAIVQILLDVLGDGHILPQSMRSARVHHQLVPDKIFCEPFLPDHVIDVLSQYRGGVLIQDKIAICSGIQLTKRNLFAALDFRLSQQA